MKNKLAAFLVKRSRIILILFVLIAIGCTFLIPKVNVNNDMTEYLAKDSQMRQGLDIMEAEFGDETSSSLKLMFNDLNTKAEKESILSELESIKYVDSVDYESGDADYNKDNHTLYIINCAQDQYSEEASFIWNTVVEKYQESHDINLAGDIHDENVTNLPLWIIGSAVLLIVIIMIIMATSYIEPLAFLITIGIAVLINMGTYVLFPSISSTTFSIVALLQMVLSIDYSIMLLNRYKQQRAICDDKHQAMRDSLVLSFGAINGSSITTFAGLLALVFMSFTIGADVGLSLAKGVIISLLCIFTVLPALLLGLDNLMIKTAKNTLPLQMRTLSRLQYKLRVPITLLFIGMLICGFVIKSGTDFMYANINESDIEKNFGSETQYVMVYNAKDSDAAGSFAQELEDSDQVKSAVCYESTIGMNRTVSSMKDFIDDMSDNSDVEMDMDTDMLKLVYYDYFAGDNDLKMTISQFTNFLQTDVIDNPDYQDSLDSDVRTKINQMAKYTNKNTLVSSMNAKKLADYFGMKKSEAEQLLLYYMINKSDAKADEMTLANFVDFLIKDVATDETYGSMFDKSTLAQLESLKPYTNKEKMTTPVSYKKSAKLLGMDESQSKLLYTYHKSMTSKKYGKMTMTGLATALTDMSSNPSLASQFGSPEMQQLIGGLQQIGTMDPRQYTVKNMSATLTGYGMPLDEDTLRFVYSYNTVSSSPTAHKMSVGKLVTFITGNSKTFGSMMSKEQMTQLNMLQKIINTSVAGKKLSTSHMGKILDMDSDDVRSLYLLNTYKNGDTSSWKMTPQRFINFLISDVLNDKTLGSQMKGSAKELRMLQKIINNVVAGNTFTAASLATLLDDYSDDMDPDSISLVYKLYGSRNYYDDAWELNLVDFVHHLDDNIINNSAYDSVIDQEDRTDVADMREELDENAVKLKGDHYGRMIVKARILDDSVETRQFFAKFTETADSQFANDYYLIGTAPMAYEMSQTFRSELNKITLITALFILLIVLATFRRVVTPVILVLVIQCSVFLTMGVMNLLNIDMNYLALLIVQSIMMGATIDYAIIYSSYYVERRAMEDSRTALQTAFKGSLQTILTSALILIIAVGILSFAFSEPAVRQICRILSLGCLIATTLVIFILPAILACFDRFVKPKDA